MIEDRKLESVHSQCGFDAGICLSSMGNFGGLGFWWRHGDVSLVSFSNHHILIMEADGVNHWFACGIYRWAEHSQKHQTWDLMRSLKKFIDVSFLFFGDFNEIVYSHEKMGGVVRND
ncbi:unnamed protein product [Amaranthus hypochondriacus]